MTEHSTTYESIIQWFPLAEEVASEAPAFFVCTKIDLTLSPFLEEQELFERVLEDRANIKNRLRDVDSIHYECSAMTKEGVEEVFDSVILTVTICLNQILVMRRAILPRLEYPPEGIRIPGVEEPVQKPQPKLDAKGRPIPDT